MPDLLREDGGRQLWWNCAVELTKMSSAVCSGRSAMLAHTSLLSSSLSLMAQGFGVTIGAESEILDGEPSSANLRRALRPHCDGGVCPRIRVGSVFGIRQAVFER